MHYSDKPSALEQRFFTIDSHEATPCRESPPTNHALGKELVPLPMKSQFMTATSYMNLHLLEYLRRLDSMMDEPDLIWSPIQVLSYREPQDVLILWRNGASSWVNMQVICLVDPYMLIKYALQHKGILGLPSWQWVKHYTVDAPSALAISNAFKAAQHETKFKFGIEVPTSVRHALSLDATNGDILWREAIDKELAQINAYKTFRDLKGAPIPQGYKRIPYHLIFDVKFDLRRKARLVAGGHLTTPPKEDIYSGVVGMESVRLGFLLASINRLKVCAADIGNAFLYGRTTEKVYIIAGDEFGSDKGKPLLIDRGLYGLCTSSARFHKHLAAKLHKMDYCHSYADADMWVKDCGGSHYEYLATYGDYILSFSRDPLEVINTIKKEYILKGIGTPEYYLGGDVDYLDDPWTKDDITFGFSARTYIKNVVEKYEHLLGYELRTYKTPMDDTYHPELDNSPLVPSREASKYRGMIGSCNWMVTLGRYDIQYATQTYARFSMAPRDGHFRALQRVFGYLKKFPKGRLIFDGNPFNWSQFTIPSPENWKALYPDAQEELPPNILPPKGTCARITCFVDADHAHDQLTRQSVTGILLFINNTPIKWISKRQKTVETSTYRSELVASRMATDAIIAVRYNLCMLGVAIDGPALLLGDNRSVVLSATLPSSTLKQRHNSIAYHRVREAIACAILQFVHVDSTANLADVLTKPLPSLKFHACIKPVLFRTPLPPT